MAVRLSCPTCNTEFTLPALPENRRAVCPRCGDEFPIKSWREEGAVAPALSVAAGSASPQKPLLYRPPSRLVVMFGLPLIAATLGLGVALWVMLPQLVQQPNPEPATIGPDGVRSPSQLSGLGYLPGDTNIAFALQPEPVLAYAKRSNEPPRDLIVNMGIPANVFDSLLNLGITLDQIDHIAGSTCLGDAAAELRLTLVMVLRTPPTNEDEFFRRLKAKTQPGGKGRHDVELAGIPLPMTLARQSPLVWVFGASAKDFDAVNKGGHGAGGKQFPGALAEMLAKEVPPDAAAWLATNSENWAEKPGVQLVLSNFLKKPEWLDSIKKGRAGLAAICFGEQPRLRLCVKAADVETAKQLRGFFAERARNDDKIRHGGDADTAFFETPIEPAKAYATVLQLLSEPKKK